MRNKQLGDAKDNDTLYLYNILVKRDYERNNGAKAIFFFFFFFFLSMPWNEKCCDMFFLTSWTGERRRWWRWMKEDAWAQIYLWCQKSEGENEDLLTSGNPFWGVTQLLLYGVHFFSGPGNQAAHASTATWQAEARALPGSYKASAPARLPKMDPLKGGFR